MSRYMSISVITLTVAISAIPAAVQGQPAAKTELTYGSVDSSPLKLDLYHPGAVKAPLIVWVHGGAWRSGSKNRVPILQLVNDGYAIASVDYRLSPVARFPAQILDIHQAVAYLQKNAEEYALDPGRIAIAGASAGGHLAALAGVSQGTAFDADQPPLPKGSINAIVAFYGASNLETILAQSTPHGLSVRVPALELLLGGQPDKQQELAQLASPVQHVDRGDPPLLWLHGDQDPQMPINQAHELVGRYRALDLQVELDVVYGAAHGGSAFYTDAVLDRLDGFLRRTMR